MTPLRVNRLLSAPLTRLLLKTPLSPNQITLMSLGLGLLCGALLSMGQWVWAITAAGCHQLAVLLDNCDGEVARAKNMRSALGRWLDILTDLLTDLALFSGVALGMVKTGAGGPIGLFWVLCVSGSLIHCALVVAEQLRGFGPAVPNAPRPEHETSKGFFLMLLDALREGEASWIVVFLCLLGQTPILLWAGGVYMQLLWLSALVVNFRWLFAPKNGMAH